jgi:hypothetical protein
VAVAKVRLELVGLLVVVQRVEPIDQLAESVLEAPAPFLGRFALGFGEHAVVAAVLELDDAEVPLLAITDDDIGPEIAEKWILKRQIGGRPNLGGKSPNKGGKLRPRLEERQNVLALREGRLGGQELGKRFELPPHRDRVVNDLAEELRHCLLGQSGTGDGCARSNIEDGELTPLDLEENSDIVRRP